MRYFKFLFTVMVVAVFAFYSCDSEPNNITPVNENADSKQIEIVDNSYVAFSSFEDFVRITSSSGVSAEFEQLKEEEFVSLMEPISEEFYDLSNAGERGELASGDYEYHSVDKSLMVYATFPLLGFAKYLNAYGDVKLGDKFYRFTSKEVVTYETNSYKEFKRAADANDYEVLTSELLNVSSDPMEAEVGGEGIEDDKAYIYRGLLGIISPNGNRVSGSLLASSFCSGGSYTLTVTAIISKTLQCPIIMCIPSPVPAGTMTIEPLASPRYGNLVHSNTGVFLEHLSSFTMTSNTGGGTYGNVHYFNLMSTPPWFIGCSHVNQTNIDFDGLVGSTVFPDGEIVTFAAPARIFGVI